MVGGDIRAFDVVLNPLSYEAFFNLVCAVGLSISFLCGLGIVAELCFLVYQINISRKCVNTPLKSEFIEYNILGFFTFVGLGCLFAYCTGASIPMVIGLHYALATNLLYMAFIRGGAAICAT
jgi:hypothetical protein